MIAAWQVRPPRLVTIAEARFMIGSQSGSVMSATSTSPGWNSCICSTEVITRTGAGADLLPDRPPLDEHRPALRRSGTAAPTPAGCAGLHRLGAGLQDVELAVDAVLAPLDVHRPAVVVLDDQRLPGQLLDLGVGEAEQRRGRRRVDVDELGGPARPSASSV